MTDEIKKIAADVLNQASSTPADGAQVAPAVAVQATAVVLGGGGGDGGGAATVATGSSGNTYDTVLHDAWLKVWKAETAALDAVRNVPTRVENAINKVEGDVITDLKALVAHLHTKYDAVVARVAALEAHIEGRFGRI